MKHDVETQLQFRRIGMCTSCPRNGTEATIVADDTRHGLRGRIMMRVEDGGLSSGPKIARWLATFHGLNSVHEHHAPIIRLRVARQVWRHQEPRGGAAGEPRILAFQFVGGISLPRRPLLLSTD